VTELGREAAAERGPATSDTLTSRRYIATWTEVMQRIRAAVPATGEDPAILRCQVPHPHKAVRFMR
jgi:hypothetical protein